jgi:hypothetical protein
MSAATDFIDVAKDGHGIYKAAKKLKKDLKKEREVAQAEVKALKQRVVKLQKAFRKSLANLPEDMTAKQYLTFLKRANAIVSDRLRNQDFTLEFHEFMKLQLQQVVLEKRIKEIRISQHFDLLGALPQDFLAGLDQDLEEAQAQIKAQLQARGYANIGIRTAIFVVDLAVLVAKVA